MSSDKKRDAFLDSFWDISDLIPSGKSIRRKPRSIELTEVVADEDPSTNDSKGDVRFSFASSEQNSSNSVIKRQIVPEKVTSDKKDLESVISYSPSDSLIHEVILKKRSYSLNFYEDFERDTEKYYEIEVDDAEYEPFFSYVPQYNQLNEKQLQYYFYWRSKTRQGIFENTDYCYILLYVFELINHGNENNARDHQIKLTELWNEYHKSYPMLSGKLITWICDFSLVHKLPPPSNLRREMVSEARSLKEFFISVPDNDFDACAESLLKYCSSYDYHTSKFSKGENLKIYDKYVRGALRCAVRYYSEDGKILSRLSTEDSKMAREAFCGALCSNRNRYVIEIKYCSFSCSNELRFLVGDIIKYAENKIRAGLGIKSKLTVYSVPNELKEQIDAYFKENFRDARERDSKKEEKQEYDILYDVPQKPLSLSNAMKIEENSWNTTNELIVAFEEAAPEDLEEETPVEKNDKVVSTDYDGDADPSEEDGTLKVALGALYDIALAIKNNDKEKLNELTRGKMADAIVDEINEISVDLIGDILIEQDETGGFVLIECYRDMI